MTCSPFWNQLVIEEVCVFDDVMDEVSSNA